MEFLFEPTEFEKSILTEVNIFRSNPMMYFLNYIKDRNDWYDGTKYQHQMQKYNAHEGYASLEADLAGLNGSIGQIAWNNKLFYVAKEHCMAQGETELTGHDRVDGTSWKDAISRYGTYKSAGENISYSMNSARTIVIQLLLDDGLASRGHRKNMLNDKWNGCGVSYGRHAKYGYMAVLDFAADWKDK